MKRFIETKFYLTLREASQRGADPDAQVLENNYGEFFKLLFSEGVAPANGAACRYALINTRVELASLTEVSGKNAATYLCKAIQLIDRQIEWTEKQLL